MMTSWHCNTFRITGPLWGEAISYPHVMEIVYVLFIASPSNMLNKQSTLRRFETPWRLDDVTVIVRSNIETFSYSGLCVLCLVAPITWAIHINSEIILLKLHQDPFVSRLVSNYNTSMMTSWNRNVFRVTGLFAGNSPVTGEFPSKRPVTRALMFSLNWAWINGWVNNREAGYLRRHRAHCDVTVMMTWNIATRRLNRTQNTKGIKDKFLIPI